MSTIQLDIFTEEENRKWIWLRDAAKRDSVSIPVAQIWCGNDMRDTGEGCPWLEQDPDENAIRAIETLYRKFWNETAGRGYERQYALLTEWNEAVRNRRKGKRPKLPHKDAQRPIHELSAETGLPEWTLKYYSRQLDPTWRRETMKGGRIRQRIMHLNPEKVRELAKRLREPKAKCEAPAPEIGTIAANKKRGDENTKRAETLLKSMLNKNGEKAACERIKLSSP